METASPEKEVLNPPPRDRSRSHSGEPLSKQVRKDNVIRPFGPSGLKVIVPKRAPPQRPAPTCRPTLIDMDVPSSSSSSSETVNVTKVVKNVNPDRYLFKNRSQPFVQHSSVARIIQKRLKFPGRNTAKKGPLPAIRPNDPVATANDCEKVLKIIEKVAFEMKKPEPCKKVVENVSTEAVSLSDSCNLNEKDVPQPTQQCLDAVEGSPKIDELNINKQSKEQEDSPEATDSNSVEPERIKSEITEGDDPAVASPSVSPILADKTVIKNICNILPSKLISTLQNETLPQKTVSPSDVEHPDAQFYVGRGTKDDTEFLYVSDFSHFTSDANDIDGNDFYYGICRVVSVFPTFQKAQMHCFSLCSTERLSFAVFQSTLTIFSPHPLPLTDSTTTTMRAVESIASNIKNIEQLQQDISTMLNTVHNDLHHNFPALNANGGPTWTVPLDKLQKFKKQAIDGTSFLRLYYRSILTTYEIYLPEKLIPSWKLDEVRRGFSRFYNADTIKTEHQNEQDIKSILTCIRSRSRQTLQKHCRKCKTRCLAIGKTSMSQYFFQLTNRRRVPFLTTHFDVAVRYEYNEELDLGIPVEEKDQLFIVTSNGVKYFYKVYDVRKKEIIFQDSE